MRKTKNIKFSWVLLIKDIISTLWKLFVLIVLVAVCLENGWLNKVPMEVSREAFWTIFRFFSVRCLPFIFVFKIVIGRYYCRVEKCSLCNDPHEMKMAMEVEENKDEKGENVC